MTNRAAQFIDPRDAGLRGLDLPKPLFDDADLARAEDTLKALSNSMQQWLDADVEKLQLARLTCEAASWRFSALEAVLGAGHDLKGMGATYGYPIVTQIAASLCRLIETEAGKATAQSDPTLVCAHVDALRAAVRDHIKEASHPVGRLLVQTLEAHVDRLGVAPR